ncbi:response regulator [Lichenifustis flavocetrariae]|uniref:Response regulator n=1 Tax=Lichenifustis flavocetrariae TaxID=2949735 RepID=A0AA41YZE6_9HYPH|nr:response regulator [Lichenifustis flavocetrariae]MCW6509913.1 response regulator [Lichenifustis flavocetrariae]
MVDLTARHKLVAIVEDEAIVRDVAAMELEDCGFDVVDFRCADDALPYLRQHGGNISVLVTDVQMPGAMNGLDLVTLISRMWPELRMLVTSGGPLVDPGKLPPRVRFIAKPWRAADMAARVQELSRAG